MTTYNSYFGVLRIPGSQSGPCIDLGLLFRFQPQWKTGGGASVPFPYGSPLKGGTVGVVYSGAQIFVTGGTGPFTYSITGGALPPGLTLNTSTGAIAGTPTTPGVYSFTVQVQDSTTTTGSNTFELDVSSPPVTASNYGFVG